MKSLYRRVSRKAIFVIALSIITVITGGVFANQAFAENTAPSHTGMLISPNGGENLSGEQPITWDTTNCVLGDTINLVLAYAGTAVTPPVALPPSTKTIAIGLTCLDGSYTWNTNDFTSDPSIGDRTDFLIGLEHLNADNVQQDTDHSDNYFIVDNTPPAFTVNKGTDSGPVKTDTINVTVDASISGLASTAYGFSTTDSSCSSADYTSGDAGTFDSGVDFDIRGNHTDYLCVKATDNAGNTGYKQVGRLNTDNTAPSISNVVGTTIQGSGATAANDTIAISFDEAVKPADGIWSANEISSIKSPEGAAVNLTGATYAYDSTARTLTITLDEAHTHLKNGDAVTATPAVEAITDIAGNPLPTTQIIGLHGITGDVTKPTVAITYLNSGPVKNGDVVTVTATFDELLEPAVTPTISIAVPGTGDVSSTAMTPTSANPLVWTYNWTVTNGGDGNASITIAAEDMAGNTNASATNNTIVVDNTAPTITSYTLNGNSTNVYFNPNNSNNSSIDIKINASELVKFTEIYVCPVSATTCDGSNDIKNFTDIGSFMTDSTKSWDGTKSGTNDFAIDGAYKLGVKLIDEAGNTASIDLSSLTTLSSHPTMTVDMADPSMSISAPTTGLVVHNTNGNIQFTFATSDTNLDTCAYEVDGGSYSNIPCTSPDTLTLGDGRQTVTLKATDKAGNSTTDSVNFVVDTNRVLTVAKSGTPDFATIQGAIDAWVSGIATIDVAAGTYPESVTVNQALTIKGPNYGIDPNTGTRTGEAFIVSPNTGSVVTVASDGVKIDGFDIQNGATDGTGIYSSDYSNLDIKNNIITNIGNTNDDIVGRGIEVISSAKAVDTVSITNNKINDITSGKYVSRPSGTSASGISIGWSTGTKDITNLLIQGNVISDIDADTSPWGSGGYGAYGILINHSTGSGGQTPGAEIKDNTIGDLEGLWAHGIGLEGDTPNAVVTGNTISGLIDHKGGTDGIAIFAQDNPSISTITISGNKMSNTPLGVAIHPDLAATSAGVLDATNNWWGDATGPYSATSNPNGSGVAVWPSVNDGMTSYVKFNPFCADMPVYDESSSEWSCSLVSSNPIASFGLSFDPSSQTVNNDSTLTVTAKDAEGYTVVNDTTTPVSLSVVSGTATLNDLNLTMGANGTTATTITSNVAGTAGVRAVDQNKTSAFGTGSITFTAGAPVDTTPPVVTNFSVSNVALTSATLNVTTNEDATCHYATVDSSYANMTNAFGTTGGTTHTENLTGLTSNTPYTYYVRCEDTVGNDMVASANASFTTTTVNTTPPELLNIQTLDIGTSTATVSWTTNESATSEVDYGLTSAYGTTEASSTALVHKVVLTGLMPNTTYHFIVKSANLAGYIATSVDGTFTTVVDDSTATYGVTGITAIKTYATTGGGFAEGWQWIFHVTVPTNETNLSMKFGDFLGNDGSTIPVASNLRFYSAQSSNANASTTAITVNGSNVPSANMALTGDITPKKPGRQVDITVEMKIPTGTTGGSYSTSYGIETTAPTTTI
ncbi:MAG TPA: hypothetical protein ENJ75_02225 [Candidatus Kaiserbacteria bacterium]|nr:hypothetical protein [Candidatus Kaiserbacteria bacterium]